MYIYLKYKIYILRSHNSNITKHRPTYTLIVYLFILLDEKYLLDDLQLTNIDKSLHIRVKSN